MGAVQRESEGNSVKLMPSEESKLRLEAQDAISEMSRLAAKGSSTALSELYFLAGFLGASVEEAERYLGKPSSGIGLTKRRA